MENEDMAVHVDGNASGFAELDAPRKPGPVCDFLVPDGWRRRDLQTTQPNAQRAQQTNQQRDARFHRHTSSTRSKRSSG
jgi:hypothetical protein